MRTDNEKGAPDSFTRRGLMKRAAGAVMVGAGVPLVGQRERRTRQRTTDIPRAVTKGRINQSVADWCFICFEMDRTTFGDPRVVEASGDFVMLKADLTRADTFESSALAFRYGILGFPTLVFIGPDGKEREDLRVVQFEVAETMLDRFERLKSG